MYNLTEGIDGSIRDSNFMAVGDIIAAAGYTDS